VGRFINVNSAQRDHAPWLSPDQLTLYFSSRRASANDDIWRSTRVTSGVDFPVPTPVTELGSSGNDVGITLSDDGLVTYFASNRTGGLGGMDIYRSARAALIDPFSAPELVPGVNTIDDDAAPQLTADAQELFFVSDRNGNDSQIFRVSTVCP
jgi:Tol biopolymer transport system component